MALFLNVKPLSSCTHVLSLHVLFLHLLRSHHISWSCCVSSMQKRDKCPHSKNKYGSRPSTLFINYETFVSCKMLLYQHPHHHNFSLFFPCYLQRVPPTTSRVHTSNVIGGARMWQCIINDRLLPNYLSVCMWLAIYYIHLADRFQRTLLWKIYPTCSKLHTKWMGQWKAIHLKKFWSAVIHSVGQ